MTQDFLAAVVDTILPGCAPAEAGGRAVPSGSQAGVGIDTAQSAAAVALLSIIEQSGGAEAFVRADEHQRIAVLEAVERERASEFRGMVMALLQDYYESEVVLIALGASAEPPQPGGRPVAPTEQPILDMLDKVRRRGPLWRPAG